MIWKSNTTRAGAHVVFACTLLLLSIILYSNSFITAIVYISITANMLNTDAYLIHKMYNVATAIIILVTLYTAKYNITYTNTGNFNMKLVVFILFLELYMYLLYINSL